ncbi:DoxX family protein [Antrihabitans cavernicola]|uniref:DoxX family protein n=1 Tax=Antrihabitans cavernicola TaxID=2495913 RepID=A0A5A7SCF8_9NOCA|nr:DoxX family protein [Spelaeibacter cavernicola]KAA0022427.1 hypothetical protein FOY51_11985 [Spelaeibacter cavernicola]
MDVAAVVCSVALAVAAMVSGVPKVQLQGLTWAFMRSRGISANQVRAIGSGELIGVVGLMAGLFWRPAGVVAAALLLLLFGGAVVFHVRHGDYGNPDMRMPALAPFALTILSFLTLVVVSTTL